MSRLARAVWFRVAGAVLVLALTASGPARAQPASAEQRVAVHTVGELSGKSLERALGAWFQGGRYRLDVIAEPTLDARRLLAPPPDYLLHAWLSLESGFVYIRLARSDHAPSHARYLLRRLQLSGELDLLAIEQVAQMAHSSIEALLEQQSATPEREFLETLPGRAPTALPPASPSTSAPSATADTAASRGRRSDRKLVPRLAFALAGRALSADAWVYGPGLSAGITWKVSSFALGPLARLAYGLPTTVQKRDLELTFRSQSASVGLAFSQVSAFGIDVLLGPHLERTELDVTTLDSTLRAEAVPTDLRVHALLAAGAHWHTSGIRLALQAFVLVPIPAASFVLAEPSGERTVFSLWRAQPGLMLELGPAF